MKKWECPECGEENSHQMTLCPCGYRDEPLLKFEPCPAPEAQQPKPVMTPSPLTIDKEHPKSGETQSWQTYQKKTDTPADWRHSYSRWMLVVISIVFFLRKTTDGLWFIAFSAYSIAKRLEERKKYGTPILYGKKKDESIWEYGVSRTITALLAPVLLTGLPDMPLEKIQAHEHGLFNMPRWGARILVTICALHLYIGIVGLFDTISPEGTAQLLTIVNTPFTHLLNQWPAYLDCAEEFVSHGYAYRLPLLNHIYITCIFGALLFFWFTLLEICDGDLEGRYDKSRELQANQKAYLQNPFSEGFRALLRWYPSRVVFFYLFIVGLFYFFKYVSRLPLHFPGEAYARHGKYAWMASAAYIDNIGFFTPIYLILPIFTFFCIAVTFAFEPLYRSMLYVKRLFKKLLVG